MKCLLKCHYLWSFHWQDEEEEEYEEKVINLELVFGYHWKPGSGPQVACGWWLAGKDHTSAELLKANQCEVIFC